MFSIFDKILRFYDGGPTVMITNLFIKNSEQKFKKKNNTGEKRDPALKFQVFARRSRGLFLKIV